MNDIRRTILWVIFGFSMVLLWDKWQVFNGQKPTFGMVSFPPVTSSPKAPAVTAAPASSVPAVVAAVPGTTVPVAVAAPSTIPATNSAALPAAAIKKERIVMSNDVLTLSFDTEGGALVRSVFTKYADMKDKNSGFVLLDESNSRVYVAQSGLIGPKGEEIFPTHKTLMTALPAELKLQAGQSQVEIKFESPAVGGVKLVKTYTLQRGAYDLNVRHDIVNTGSEPVAPQLYLQLVRDGNKPEGESAFYSTFTGPAVYTDAKKYQKVEFSEVKKKNAIFEKSSTNGYIAMVQHYFVSAWILPDGVQRNIDLDTDNGKVADCCYRVNMVAPLGAIAPGASKSIEAKIFIGPQEEKVLEALTPGLELVKDYGWLTILSKPLYWLLDKLHGFIHNWGWSIMALVLLLKIAFYWLNAKAYASMAKMKAINPKIMEMRERFKDKPQEMQQQMMKIYKEEKVNPMGGCFPIMVQIPVFIALYWVLLSSVEMRGAPWVLWIKDLSAPDTLFGTIPGINMPFGPLPIIMTLTTMLQTALNPAPPDPMQAKLMWFMPLIFSVMFFVFPAGLVLYWITNNVLSIAQQWLINTRMGVPPEFNLPKFK
jgi:YidC/Oxa1 family membrane protein insertase